MSKEAILYVGCTAGRVDIGQLLARIFRREDGVQSPRS
eukprot:gene6362-biopygen13636